MASATTRKRRKSKSATARCSEKKEKRKTTKSQSSQPSPSLPPPPPPPPPSFGATTVPSYSPATMRKRNGVGASAGSKNASLPLKIMKEMMTRPEDRGNIRTFVQVQTTASSSPKQRTKQKQKQKKECRAKQMKHDTPEEDGGNDLQESWTSSSSWWTLESPSSPRSTSSSTRRKTLSNNALRHVNTNKDQGIVDDDDASAKSAPTVVLPGTSSPSSSRTKRRKKRRHGHTRGGLPIKLPFGFDRDDHDDGANMRKMSSEARKDATHGDVNSVKNETKNKRKSKTKSSSPNRKKKNRKEKKKSMKKVNSSSETSVTTQSLSKLDSSSTSLHLSLKDEESSPLDRWGGQSSKNFDHLRQDYNAIAPPNRPIRRSITPPSVAAESTAAKLGLTMNVALSMNDTNHGSLSKTPLLTCDDGTDVVVTTDKESIGQGSRHHTTQSPTDTCLVVGKEDLKRSDDHNTAKSAAPVKQSPAATTQESSTTLDRQEESDSGKSVQMISPRPATSSILNETPKQKHDTTMTSPLISSPTSVLESFFHLPITSPTECEKKSVEESPLADPTENDHSSSEEIVAKSISPMEECGSLSHNHFNSPKSGCINPQRPKLDASEKLIPTKTTQQARPCSGVDTSASKSADAEIAKPMKIEPCRIATKSVTSQPDNGYASFYASSFGSIDLNDVHGQKGATHPSFAKIAATRQRSPPPSEEHVLSPIVQERKKLRLLLDTQLKNGKTQRRIRKSTRTAKTSILERDTLMASMDDTRRRNEKNPTFSPKKEPEKSRSSKVATKGKHVTVDTKKVEERGNAPFSPFLNSLNNLKKAARASTKTVTENNIYKEKISTLRSHNMSHTKPTTTPGSPAMKSQSRRGSTMALTMAKLWEEKLIPSISPSHQHENQNRHQSQQKQSRCQSSMSSFQPSPPKSQHGCGRSKKLAARWESAVFNPPLMT